MSTEVPFDRVLEKVKEAIESQQSVKSDKAKQNQIKCSHQFGYLSELPKSSSIPEECFFCSKVVDCIANL